MESPDSRRDNPITTAGCSASVSRLYFGCAAGSRKDGVERGLRNRKLVEMGLLQVAKAIAEGKVKPSVSDLDRLIRLEEFLREERVAGEQTKIVLEWRDASNPSEDQDTEAGGPETEEQ